MRREHRMERAARILAVALAVSWNAACGTVLTLRDAQDAFSGAVRAEYQLRTSNLDTTGFTGLVAQRDAGYSAVVQIVDGVSAMDRRSLESQKLWGHVLALKAIAQWRLARYDEAKQTATAAFGDAVVADLGARDRAVLAALPGLIKIDQAYAKLSRDPPAINEAIALLEAGNGDIKRVRNALDREEPVQGYLIQAQLAGDRNRVRARGQSGLEPEEIRLAESHLCDLKTFFSGDGISDDEETALRGWKNRIGLTRECPET